MYFPELIEGRLKQWWKTQKQARVLEKIRKSEDGVGAEVIREIVER